MKMEPAEFPKLPTDLSIGLKVMKKFAKAHFHGAIKPGFDDALGIYAGEAIISLHERGVKIENKYYEKQLDLHVSQIASINEITQAESYIGEKSNIAGFLLAIMLVLTLGIVYLIATDLFRDGSRDSTERIKYVSYFVLTFWDINTRCEQKIFISGSKHKINKFIRQYETK